MRAAWLMASCAFALIAGCAGDDGEGEGEGETSTTQGLVAAMLDEYERAAVYRCECLVAGDVLYDSVDECLMVLAPMPSWRECVAMAFETDGTAELEAAMRCHTDHLRSAQDCAESAGCPDSIDGACDAMASEDPCGESTVQLIGFVLGHCPDIPMNAQP